MSMRRHTLPTLLGLALLLASCAKDYGTSTSFDPLYRFPATATWSWDTRATQTPQDPRLMDSQTDALIRDAVRAEFAARGYNEVGGRADFRMSYQLAIHTWTGPDHSTAVASFSLQMVDSQSGSRVWLGFARAQVHVGLSQEESRARIRSVVAEMVKDFPPPQR